MIRKAYYMRAEKYRQGKKVGECWAVQRVWFFTSLVTVVREWVEAREASEGVVVFVTEVTRLD